MKKKVYLVGAGPGRPDLITVRGANILKEADVVIYDYLVDGGILEYAREGAELISCDMPAGRQREEIADLTVNKAKEGKKVVRLKNGDVSIFSRLSRELEVLVKNKIDFELVPGVTAASGAAACAGIPLTDRKSASDCIFVTGRQDPEKQVDSVDWEAVSRAGTIVLYMAVENLAMIAERLIRAGKPQGAPCVIVQNAAGAGQKIVDGFLGDIAVKAAMARIGPPAVVIIGEAAGLRRRFDRHKKYKSVLLTGLSKERFFIKGRYFHLPLIKIEPMGDYGEFDNHLKNIACYDWIIFTSRNGVEYFFKRLKIAGFDSRILFGVRIAAIGNSTRDNLLDLGIRADLVPGQESSKGLIEEMKKTGLANKKIFLPRSDISARALEEELERSGAKVTTVCAYRNVLPERLPAIKPEDFDEIVFNSPSAVRNFKKIYGEPPNTVKIRCGGNVTLREVKKWGK